MTDRSKPKLLLHVGSHKTGTTSIQSALAANRAWLEAHGIYYPNPRPFFYHATEAHHDLAHALASGDARRMGRAKRFRRHLIEASRRHDRILLSAEPFYRHVLAPLATGEQRPRVPRPIEARRLYIARTAEFLDAFDTEVIVFLRRPDSFAVSLYKSAVVSTPFSGGFDKFIERRNFRVDYKTQIDLFGAYFPKVTYKSYESGLGAGIVETFFDTIGAGSPPSLGSEHLRRSLTNKATLWIDRSRQELNLSRRQVHRRWRFAMLPEAGPLFGPDDGSSLWNSADERDAFIERLAGTMPTGFFPEPRPDLPPRAVWTDAEHRAASAAFREWERANATGLRLRELLGVPPYKLDEPAAAGGFLAGVAALFRSGFRQSPGTDP